MPAVKKSAASRKATARDVPLSSPRPPRNVKGAEGHPTIPAAYSVACRSCGQPVGYDTADVDVVTCGACDTVNVVPGEELADAAD